MKEFNIDGKTYSYNFGMKALYDFIELKGQQTDQIKLIGLACWLGFRHGQRLRGVEFKHPISVVEKWLDENFDLFTEISHDLSKKLLAFNNNNRHL